MSARMTVKKFLEMTPDERDEYVKEFDKEFIADTFRPLTPKQRAAWERIRRKRPRGRPVRGKGSTVISISVERELLAASDRLARKKHISRSSLIARGLRAVLAVEGVSVPPGADAVPA